MKIKYLVLVLMISTQVFAQTDFRINYYPKIYEAEAAIIKDSIAKANQMYEIAFSYVKKPLAKDLFNAAVCKFLLNDFEGAKPLLFKLAEKGISADILEKKEIFSLTGVKNTWELFKPLYESVQNEIISNRNLDFVYQLENIKDSINSTFKMSIIYVDFGKGLKYYDTRKIDFSKIKDSLYLKTLLPIDSLEVGSQENRNIKKAKNSAIFGREILNEVLRNKGILAENNFEFSSNNFLVNSFFQNLTFFYSNRFVPRYVQGRYVSNVTDSLSSVEKEILGNALIDASASGNLNPIVAFRGLTETSVFLNNLANIYVVNIEDTTGCSQGLREKGRITYLKRGYFSSEDINKYEKWRADFGLDKLENLIKKEVYAAIRNRYFIFTSNKVIEESTVPNCEIALKMISESEVIEE